MEKDNTLKVNINESDILKVFAVTGAIMQSVLGFLLKDAHATSELALLGVIYNLVKYTAPVFIFAIVYGMVKGNEHTPVGHFYKEKFYELVVPYILWATASLIFIPRLQQNRPVTSFETLVESYFVGNASPQYWYTVMMLQFQVLMPVIIFVCYKFLAKPSRVVPLLVGSFIVFAGWLWLYDTFVFHGVYASSLRYLDRVFVSYFIYALLGGIAWVYKERFDKVIQRIQFILIPALLILLIWTNHEFFNFGFKNMSFGNIIYLKPSMMLYSLVVIFLVYMFARHLIMKKSSALPFFKWLSNFAYRAFTANVFILTLVLKLYGNLISKLPFFVSLLLVFLVTVTCSFLTVYFFSQMKVWIQSFFSKKEMQSSSSEHVA
jgi:hypothetical protein